MTNFFGYIRVSTARQGERGVSLQEQRDAIERYVRRHGLTISQWFEERETAAKLGRPAFTDMLRRLRRREAAGVVIHKIDRSARNLKDWAELGELIDRGVEVHFAHESLDLHSRGGRLTADIQAVVAADYVRNLREEARKGFYGRLKQGCYPLPAPIGYQDQGAGKPKTIDPVKGPLVRRAFELYATGRYGLVTLAATMKELGLRTRSGKPITINGLSTVLNNPFYIGIIRLKRSGEHFEGAHKPLIPKALFDRVQATLRGNTNARVTRHTFPFRRLLRCGGCGYSLIGERQKGHIYYRCHTRHCATKSIREETVEEEVARVLKPLRFSDAEKRYLEERLGETRDRWTRERDSSVESFRLELERVGDRLQRLTDAYLDGVVEKDLFEERKERILLQRQELQDRIATAEQDPDHELDRVADFLELAGSAHLQYRAAIPEERRELVATITSNRVVNGRDVAMTLNPPFQLVAERNQNTNGRAYRDGPRTLDVLLEKLLRCFAREERCPS